jgi:hypothetical protein
MILFTGGYWQEFVSPLLQLSYVPIQSLDINCVYSILGYALYIPTRHQPVCRVGILSQDSMSLGCWYQYQCRYVFSSFEFRNLLNCDLFKEHSSSIFKLQLRAFGPTECEYDINHPPSATIKFDSRRSLQDIPNLSNAPNPTSIRIATCPLRLDICSLLYSMSNLSVSSVEQCLIFVDRADPLREDG